MGIEIGIDPVIFTVGGFEIRWYGVISAIGMAVAIIIPILLARGKNTGVTREQILSIAPWAILGGIVFARLIHVLDKWSEIYSKDPWSIFGLEGLGIFGAIIGATIAGVIYAKIAGFPIGKIADLAAPGAILGQAIGRIGCIINGCCYGEPTDLPWGVFYTHPSSEAFKEGHTEIVHPTHAYELLFDLALFGVLMLLRGKLRRDGALFLIYLIAYSIGRFLITMLRVNDPFLFGLMEAQVISIIVVVIAVPVLVWLYKRPVPRIEKVPVDNNSSTSQASDGVAEE